MNPDSLDSSIQSALLALYPPLEATAPTVLSQLSHVIQGRYGGDALQCLIDFLTPARRLLERVRQAACVPYADLALLCSGWPLCLYDCIVIHLAPINPLLLSFEDFYLQVVPFDKQVAHIVVRSLSNEDQHYLEITPIPESSLSCIFTQDWLKELNVGRHGRLLSHCVLATGQCIVKVPWDQVAYPEFEDQPQHMDSFGTSNPQEPLKGPSWQGYSVETRICPAKNGIAVSLCLVDSSRQSEMNKAILGTKPLGWVSPTTWDSRSKEYCLDEDVDNVDLTKEKHEVENSQTSASPRTCLQRPQKITPSVGHGHTAHDRPTCGRTVRFAEQPCTPCLRRKHGQGTKNQECRYKEYCREEPCSVQIENRQKELITSERTFIQTINNNSNKNHRNVPDHSQGICADLAEQSTETITCTASTTDEAESEKYPNAVQRYPGERKTDSKTEMIPKLHVAQGKNTTTFGLISPKLNRRKPPIQEEAQDHKNLPLCAKTVSSLRHIDIKKCGRRSLFPAPSKPETCLLQEGLSCFTGGRDRSNRVVVEVYGDHQHWGSSLLSSLVLSKLLLYFHTIIRKEEREFGMTIVYDSRKVPEHPEVFEALQMVQEQNPNAIHCVLLLISKGKTYSMKKYPGDMEVMTSLKDLHRYIEYSQLSPALEGTFLYSHRNWLHLHEELYPFVSAIREATHLLLEAIRMLNWVHKVATAQDVQQCIDDQRALMKHVLEDTQLVTLQREGGALLARLRWESDVRTAHYETSWKVMDTVDCLYNEVEEHVHVLVKCSNMSFQHLGFLLHLRRMESSFTEIKEWFDAEAERLILEAESVEEPSRNSEEILQCLTTVLSEVNEHKLQAMVLLNEAESIQVPIYLETEVFHISTFKSSLSDFLSRAEQYCDELNVMQNLCHFCKRATEVAMDCSQGLKQERLQCMNLQEKWAALQGCHKKLSQFSPELFQEAKTQTCFLQNPWGRKLWNMTWLRCQEVSRQLEDTSQELEQDQYPEEPVTLPYEWHAQEPAVGGPASPQPDTQHKNPIECPEVKTRQNRDSIHGTVTCFNISFRHSRKGRKGSKIAAVPESDHRSTRKTAHDHRQQTTVAGSDTVGCQWFNWHHNSTKHTKEHSFPATSCSKIQSLPPTFTDSTTSPSICFNSQVLGPTCSGTPTSVLQNPMPHSRIFGLETLGCETRQPENASHSEDTASWVNEAANTRSSPGMESCLMKLQCIMEELLLTELEYVRSLGYILTHYLPLLARSDVPPDLRGQRGRIFGNLEKLYDFHGNFFLRELEACRTEPLHVGRCFLRHRANFGLYALYSKNKPQSDALIQQHKFFKCKQLELGDSMDLSSYLLKPVQRISKYSLLLQEMLDGCGDAHDTEHREIQGAAEVVRFQLRHANDLLTMDAIQDCDVNLQEQGQLIRQDELHVTFRKKRSLRRVFLFQDLILFTKTKKTHHGDDVYVYKQSFKTCDIGLTQNCGQSGLCFEIWFRRRRAQDTYTLQSERQEVKKAWTADLERILWEQALKNRELRQQEQAFLGMACKPFVKIQPREAAIHDSTITCFLQGGERSLTAPRQPSDTQLPRPESIGSTSGSQSSSSSGRGSLSPSGFRENQAHENQIPRISCQSSNHAIAESPGRYGSSTHGTPASCSDTRGMFTPPAGSTHVSPALSSLSGAPHETPGSYFAEG